MGKFFRRIVAPVAAVVATVFLGPLVGIAVYNQMATFGANLERGRGFFESWGRGALAGMTTLAFGSVAGGAVSAALTGQDPGRGALLGLVQGAAAAVGAGMGVPVNPFVAVAQSAAIGAASGAAGAAIVGGDPLQGAWMGAASAAAVTAAIQIGSALIRSGNLQQGLDTARNGGAGADADPILGDAAARGGMEKAWHDSRSGNFFLRHEEGGWVVKNGDALSVQRWPSGVRAGINPTTQPKNAVGSFHTHPNPPTDLIGRQWTQGPSGPPYDMTFTKGSGVPGYVISRDTIYRADPSGGITEFER